MKWIYASALLAVTVGAAAAAAQDAAMTPDKAIAELKAGNARYVSQHFLRPRQTTARMHELATGQHPEAAILTCADSRVPPEIIFDQGLGDLFDVRVAGNVASDTETASLEYAAEHLHCPVIVVMGHQKCGAVSAAAEAGDAPGHLPSLITLIKPAVDKAAGMPGDKIDNAVRINVENVVKQLTAAKPILSEAAAAGHLKIVGAVYSLDTGKVDWLK
jgi:carbonic anhydrase